MSETGSSSWSKPAFVVTLARCLVSASTPLDGLAAALDLVVTSLGARHVRLYELAGEWAVTLLHRGDGATPSNFPDRIATGDLAHRRARRTPDGTTYHPLRHDGGLCGAVVLAAKPAGRELDHDALALLAAAMSRHQAGQVGRDVEFELTHLLDTVEDIVFVLDARTGSGIYINPAYEAVTGRSRSEWLDRRADRDSVLHPDDRAPVQELIARYLATIARASDEPSTPCRWESRILTVEGTGVWFETKMYPAYDPSGRLARLYAVSHDVSYRRGIEFELTHLLEQAHREQERTERDLRSFVHDLRGPLAALAALAQRSDETFERPDLQPLVEHIFAAAREVAELFEARVVPLLNPRTGATGTCRLLEVLEQAATLARRTLDTSCVPARLDVLADHLLLRRALTTVLAAFPGTAELVLEEGHEEVELTVSSPEATWSNIAPAAEQAAVLLAQSWGSLCVMPDARCVFTLRTADASVPSSTLLGGLRVLVVDDHEWTVEVAATVLREAGAEVETQNRAEQLLPRLRNETYDVLVLDRNLPDATADELLPAIRALAPGLAILVLTADAFAQSRHDVLEAGATGYLPKPFTAETLTRSVLFARDEQARTTAR